jgi:hypothetical protein
MGWRLAVAVSGSERRHNGGSDPLIGRCQLALKKLTKTWMTWMTWMAWVGNKHGHCLYLYTTRLFVLMKLMIPWSKPVLSSYAGGDESLRRLSPQNAKRPFFFSLSLLSLFAPDQKASFDNG